MLPKHPHITKPTHKNTPNVHGTFMPKNFFVTGLQLVKKFPAFYGTRRFITAFTSARHISISWASSIQSIPPHPTSWRSILILSSHLRLGLANGLFLSGFPTKILYTPLLSLIRATCSVHLIQARWSILCQITHLNIDRCLDIHTLLTYIQTDRQRAYVSSPFNYRPLNMQ